MADLSQMGQLTSKEAQPIVLPQQRNLPLPKEPAGFSFRIPTCEPKALSPASTPQTTEAPAPAPSAFTPQTTEEPTSLTEALQMTILTLTYKNEQLENQNRTLTYKNAQLENEIRSLKKENGALGNKIHKIRVENKRGSARRGRPQKDMLWNQLKQVISNEDNRRYWYTHLLGDCLLARQLLRVDLCWNGNDCIHRDKCRYAHSEAEQMNARSNWDCPNVDCTRIDRVTGGKCMWKHPEKTASENTDE